MDADACVLLHSCGTLMVQIARSKSMDLSDLVDLYDRVRQVMNMIRIISGPIMEDDATYSFDEKREYMYGYHHEASSYETDRKRDSSIYGLIKQNQIPGGLSGLTDSTEKDEGSTLTWTPQLLHDLQNPTLSQVDMRHAVKDADLADQEIKGMKAPPVDHTNLAQKFTLAFEMKDHADKWARLMKLSSDFEDQSKAYARIIVMELHMNDSERKIPIVKMGKVNILL